MEVVQAIIPHYRKIEREAQHILFQAWIQDEEAVLEWFRHYEEIDEVYTPPKTDRGRLTDPLPTAQKNTGRKLVEEWLGAGRMNALAVGD